MAVRLKFDNQHEYARWVLQDEAGHQPFVDAGLKFSQDPSAFSGSRDLVLDGYWKDIMLLQHFGKLQQDGELARAYADCRMQLESGRRTGDHRWWWDQVESRTIDGIWFMWTGEHDPRLLDMLQGMQPNEYDRLVASGGSLSAAV